MTLTIAHTRCLVVGLGRSGLAAARFLKARGAEVTVTDAAREEALGTAVRQVREMGLTLELGGHRVASFETADLIVLSPGVPHTIAPLQAARARGVPVVGELELAARFIAEPMVAVTGTNGKTTTTSLLGHMLERSGRRTFVGGNIGLPLSAYLNQDERADVLVVEVSSFQLDTAATFHPTIGVLLNLAADHLDRYPDFAAYAASKLRLFAHQQPGDWALLNGSDPLIRDLARPLAGQRLYFSGRRPEEPGVSLEAGVLSFHLPGHPRQQVSLAETRLFGPHNLENVAAASLAALVAGGTLEGIGRALRQFPGLPHRLEPVGEYRGVRFFNDSKATNVDAVARALASFEGPVILIMGGRNKKDDFRRLAAPVRRHVKLLIVMGEAREEIREALAGDAPVRSVDDMDEAVRTAARAAVAGDIVLLSPACASFDMYTDYTARGDHFRAAFDTLTGKR